LLTTNFKDLKAQDVDRDIAFVKVVDDPLAAVVERAGHNDDLMVFVDSDIVERRSEPRFKVLGQIPPGANRPYIKAMSCASSLSTHTA